MYERQVTTPYLTAVRLGGSPSLPLLVLGPALGTSARALWSRCAAQLTDRFEVLAWDLPGHGSNTEVAEPFSIADLAAGVRILVDDVLTTRGEPGGSFSYAGDSVGGAVGLQLLLDIPLRVDRAVLVCTGAIIGTPHSWAERAATVRCAGTVTTIERATRTWFSAGFLHLEPAVVAVLLQALRDADDEGYAQVCDALATFDVRDRLDRIRTPVVAVAGSLDESTPVAGLQEIADGVRNGELIVLDDVAHLAAAEAPEAIARIIRDDPHSSATSQAAPDFASQVSSAADDRARGVLLSRGGLDPRSRSVVTLTAVVLVNNRAEIPGAVRDALGVGLTPAEINEIVVQSAGYTDLPTAQSAYRVLRQALDAL